MNGVITWVSSFIGGLFFIFFLQESCDDLWFSMASGFALEQSKYSGQMLMSYHIVSQTLQAKQAKSWQCLKTSLRHSLH